MRTAVILQSNYIPWRGYFDLLRKADVFVLYDEVQYTRRDWRNRNKIASKNGLQWLTIPVLSAGKYDQSIAETKVTDNSWTAKHWRAVTHCYGKATNFSAFGPHLESCYEAAKKEVLLSRINEIFLRACADYLQIDTPFAHSCDVPGDADPTGRLLQICQHFGADNYLSGSAAKSYLDVGVFERAKVQVEWMSYPDYPATSSNPENCPASIIDALFWLPVDRVFDE